MHYNFSLALFIHNLTLQVTNVLVGEVDFLDKPVSAFVRLANATILGDFTEVPLPSRFVFVLLGPKVLQYSYYYTSIQK